MSKLFQPTTIPAPIGYEPSKGVGPTFSFEDHIHSVSVEDWKVPVLSNGWTDGGTVSTQGVGYLRDPSGFIHIRGRINAGTLVAGTILFTLDVGSRPKLDLRVPVITNTGAGIITLVVRLNGDVEIGPTAASANLYFNTIFEANRDQIAVTRS